MYKILNFIWNSFSLFSEQFINYRCILYTTALYPWDCIPEIVAGIFAFAFSPKQDFLDMDCFHIKLYILKYLLLHDQSFILQRSNLAISIYSAPNHKYYQLEAQPSGRRARFRATTQFILNLHSLVNSVHFLYNSHHSGFLGAH